MFFVLTTYGQSIQASLPTIGPLTYKLGSSSGYTPTASATDIVGSLIKTSKTSSVFTATSSLVRFSIVLDYSDGPYQFGEVGLYDASNKLVAIGANATLYNKIPQLYNQDPTVDPDPDGNSITIDCYVPFDGSNPYGYGTVSNSDDHLSLGRYTSVDRLPQAGTAVPNTFLCPSPQADSVSDVDFNVVCTTTEEGIWSIDGYEQVIAYCTAAEAMPLGDSTLKYTLTNGVAPQIVVPGSYLVQFISGPSRGYVRTITTTSPTDLSLRVAMGSTVNAGDKFIIMASSRFRASTLGLLNGLSPLLTADLINSLIQNPPNKMLRIDGANKMLAELNFGNYRGVNVADPIDPKDAVNKKWVEDFLSGAQGGFESILRAIDALNEKAFFKDGSRKATGDFNMGLRRITKMTDAVADSDAVTLFQLKCFVEDASKYLVNGTNTTVTGAGTQADPWRVNVDGSETKILGSKAISIDGIGTLSSPYVSTLKISPDEANLLQMRDNGLYYGTLAPEYIRNQYVDPLNGSDGNLGSRSAPLKTIAFALSRIPGGTLSNRINLHETGTHLWPSSKWIDGFSSGVQFVTYGPATDTAIANWTNPGWPWYGSNTAPKAKVQIVSDSEVYAGGGNRVTTLTLTQTALISFAGIDIFMAAPSTPAASSIKVWRGLINGSGRVDVIDSNLNVNATGLGALVSSSTSSGSINFNVVASTIIDPTNSKVPLIIVEGNRVFGSIATRQAIESPGFNLGSSRSLWLDYDLTDASSNYELG